MNPAYLEALHTIAQPIRAAEMPRSLMPMRRLLAALGDPQKQFPSVVVTGSVGKGTTCHKIARILSTPETYAEPLTEPMHVGLYTGPHLHSFRERFVINGHMISQDEFVEISSAVFEAASRLDVAYSTFEMATALALYWFAQRKVNIAVLEVGIGGRWDAVNAVENVLAVFTPIEREHIGILGGSLQTIAWNKAGIMQAGRSAISTIQSPIVEEMLRYEAKQKGTHLIFTGDLAHSTYTHFVITKKVAAKKLDETPLHVSLPGRMEIAQIAGRTVFIDGAHTPTSARHLRWKIKQQVDNTEPVRLIIGMMRDKSAHEFLNTFSLLPRYHITLTTAPGHRAFTAQKLASTADLQQAAVEIVPDLKMALAQVYTATESLIVITGSLRMAAAAREAFGLLTPEELAEAQATRAIFEGDDYLSRLNPL